MLEYQVSSKKGDGKIFIPRIYFVNMCDFLKGYMEYEENLWRNIITEETSAKT